MVLGVVVDIDDVVILQNIIIEVIITPANAFFITLVNTEPPSASAEFTHIGARTVIATIIPCGTPFRALLFDNALRLLRPDAVQFSAVDDVAVLVALAHVTPVVPDRTALRALGHFFNDLSSTLVFAVLSSPIKTLFLVLVDTKTLGARAGDTDTVTLAVVAPIIPIIASLGAHPLLAYLQTFGFLLLQTHKLGASDNLAVLVAAARVATVEPGSAALRA